MMAVSRDSLVKALIATVPEILARSLVDEYLVIRQDLATETLGRAAPGKFVETLVQILEHLETGSYEKKPDVDAYLRKLDSRSCSLDEGLRICTARLARAMYSLRSKRTIAHKNEIDPNLYDLRLLHSCAQWVVSELVRLVSGVPMDEAAKLVSQVQVPVESLVEEIHGRRIVLAAASIREEVLVLLHSHYPETVTQKGILASLDRRSQQGVRNSLRRLWKDKHLDGDSKAGYRLTKLGFSEATAVIQRYLSSKGR